MRRTGGYVWLAASAHALEGVSEPRPGGDLVRWARVDLQAVRADSVEVGPPGNESNVVTGKREPGAVVATDRAGSTVVIDAAYVQERVAPLAKNADLSKFIL